MSQNPLDALRRNPARPTASTPERVYPDALYDLLVLQPDEATVSGMFADVSRAVFTALAIQLAEQRILDGEAVQSALRAAEHSSTLTPSEPGLQLASSRAERLATATRLVLRERLIRFANAVQATRNALATLASAHLTTITLLSSDGQTSQPTTLGHYLMAQVAPLERTQARVREAHARLNLSPLGSASGVSTAMPLQRERVAMLLGFDAPLDNTLDALVASDVVGELLSIVALASQEATRFVNDLTYWARDDVAVFAPGPALIDPPDDEPQRRAPRVLSVLRARLAQHSAAIAELPTLLAGRVSAGDEATVLAQFTRVEHHLASAADTFALLTRVLESAEIDRAGFAARANRGFATSSELADLFAIDAKLPPADARRLAQLVVSAAIEGGIDATTLKPEFIDKIALREVGRELGIEPETLSRCLAPRRFLERRTAHGAPAPSAMRAALERESLAAGEMDAWLRARHEQTARAQAALDERYADIMADPAVAWRRRPRADQPQSG